jgi:hypothetical protein
MFVVRDMRAIASELRFAVDVQRCSVRSQIDCISAATLLLSADRAVAPLIGNRRVALHDKSNGTAVTGSFEFYRHLFVLRLIAQSLAPALRTAALSPEIWTPDVGSNTPGHIGPFH